MGDLAGRVEAEERERQARMTPAERLQQALQLGQRAIETYAAAHGVDTAEARRRLERASQAGRRPSRVMLGIVE